VNIYDLFALGIFITGLGNGIYILKRSCSFWGWDKFLSILDLIWGATLIYIAVYFLAILTGWIPSAPLSQGAYIRPALAVLVNIPVIIIIARR
jgi:hypothetical protein